ncbi:hypothetical protein METHPM2_1040007 [Pseudomonas sp. PM2]
MYRWKQRYILTGTILTYAITIKTTWQKAYNCARDVNVTLACDVSSRQRAITLLDYTL